MLMMFLYRDIQRKKTKKTRASNLEKTYFHRNHKPNKQTLTDSKS